MERKRWTPKAEIDQGVLNLREKRKWQIALRRYVLDGHKSATYAPYFGLDIQRFRQWIAAQFDETLSWENFSAAWHFDHVVPVAYFDFSNESDLRLCWNFINIRVEKLLDGKARRHGIDVLAAKRYFECLHEHTQYRTCQQMLDKIAQIEAVEMAKVGPLHYFINQHSAYLQAAAEFSPEDFLRLNNGTDFTTIQYEKDFIKRLSE